MSSRFPAPFFRKPRNRWFVQLDGKQINLGPDRTKAFEHYHALMKQRSVAPSAKSPSIHQAAPPVIVLCDEFLSSCQKTRAPDTYRFYKDRLQSFCLTIPEGLTTEDLRPHHIQKWVDNYPVELRSGSRRNLIAAVKRAMKWAEEQGYIERSPIAHMKKPACGRKEQVVKPDEFEALLDRYEDQEFRDLLNITWETGCRPQESLRVEARHVDLISARWVFPTSESKGKRTPRIVYLSPKALEITKRLMAQHPSGPLFRNTDGKPWTPMATNCRFQTVRRKTGVKYSLYALRHSFATNALMRGLDAITVATLLGHSDPSMLAKVYQHLSQNPKFLHEQLLKATA